MRVELEYHKHSDSARSEKVGGSRPQAWNGLKRAIMGQSRPVPAGKPVQGMQQVQLPSATDLQDRRLTSLQLAVEKDELIRALLTVRDPENRVETMMHDHRCT